MVKLSLNVNKIATIRNSRGGGIPSVTQTVKDLIKYGATGITVHPRPDGRHILYSDVMDISRLIKDYNAQGKDIEFNIEGRPSSEFLDLVEKTRPQQCTLVPDAPEALTSNKGWDLKNHFEELKKALSLLRSYKVRSSLFISPLSSAKEQVDLLDSLKTDRVEFYTGDYAQLFEKKQPVEPLLKTYHTLAQLLEQKGIGLNAGHDLNQNNLGKLLQEVPQVKEVSIGHAFICESLQDGMEQTFKKYMKILKER